MPKYLLMKFTFDRLYLCMNREDEENIILLKSLNEAWIAL